MKKLNNILYLFLATLLMLTVVGCDDDKDGLDVSGGVKIESFSINGVEGTIDQNKGTIQVMLPLGIDLTKLTPVIKLSKGAVVTPSSDETVDLTKATKYRVTNGNLYADYTVVATHIKGEILSFSIGKYVGIIDQSARQIKVRVPLTLDVTQIIPTMTITEGATVSPSANVAQNFSDPVKYTISYMNQSFEYTVTIEKADIKTIAFLGTASTAKAIENEDEKAAYEWFSASVPDFQYISFNDIKNGTVDLNQFAVIWWHFDSTNILPSIAGESTVITSLKTYFDNGGSFFLSSWAVQYVAPLGIPKDGKAVNNTWGENNPASVISDDWGLNFTGNESHPIFAGLQKPMGEDNKVYLLGKGVKSKGHNAIWNFVEDWAEYKSAEAWTVGNGGICLASYHWDNSGKERAVVFEYPRVGKKGGVVCIGVESYDWYNEDGSIANIYRNNLEILTSNILNYLSK